MIGLLLRLHLITSDQNCTTTRPNSWVLHWGTLCVLRTNADHVLHADDCEWPTASLFLQGSVPGTERLSHEPPGVICPFISGFYLKSCQLVY